MQRSVPWGVLAFYPLVAGALLSVGLSSDPSSVPLLIPNTPFWIEYWFFIFGSTVVLHTAFFVVHVLRNRASLQWRRILWATGMFFLSVAFAPLYWWLFSANEPPQGSRADDA